MQKLILTLKGVKTSQIPQMGLRLINKLHHQSATNQFWLEYVNYIKEAEIYNKFTPHSKCLLTCVISKFDRNLIKTTSADELIRRIFDDFSNEKSVCVLNLELINMLIVCSYTLKIPLKEKQLLLILKNIKLDDTLLFNLEHTISILHSLGKYVQVYPKFTRILTSSSLVKYLFVNYEKYVTKLNPREISLSIYAFDKLKIFDDKLKAVIISTIESRKDEFDGQNLATILYSCSLNPKLHEILLIFRGIVVKNLNEFSGRELCNIACSYLKADLWDDVLLQPTSDKLPSMNIQEVCNIVNLLINKNIPVSPHFKGNYTQYLNKIHNASLLDCLTVSQSIYKWKLDNINALNTVVNNMIEEGNYQFNEKLIYLLHYSCELKCKGVVLKLADIISRNYDKFNLTNREVVILYNSLTKLNQFKQLISSIEGYIINQLSHGNDQFSNIDLITIANIGNAQIISQVVKNINADLTFTDENLVLISTILKFKDYRKLLDLILRWIEEYKVTQDESKGIALLKLARHMNIENNNLNEFVNDLINRHNGMSIMNLEHSLELLRVVVNCDMVVEGLDKFIIKIASEHHDEIVNNNMKYGSFIYTTSILSYKQLVNPRVLEAAFTKLFDSYGGSGVYPLIDDRSVYMLMNSGNKYSLPFLRTLSKHSKTDVTNDIDYNTEDKFNKIQSSVYGTLKNMDEKFNLQFEVKTNFNYSIDVLITQ